jgi:DNA mismatch repair protein MutS
MLIDDYFDYCQKYKEIYDKSVVLIQVGDFFEIYGVPETGEGANIFKLCEIMEIEKSLKKNVTTTDTKSHPYMAGFPLYIVNKYVQILTENNYTVVIIEQVTPPPKPKREVTKIISPSINIESNESSNNFLLSIYFTNINLNNNNFIVASLSYIDVITNESFIYECSEHDTQLNFEEINKIVNVTLRPSEIVVFSDKTTKNNTESLMKIQDFINNFPNICIHNKLEHDINDNFFKLSYQKTILEKVYKNTGLLSVLEYLNIEKKPLSIVSFSYLIQFIYEHSEKILEGIKKPEIIEDTKYMLLINNAVQNLNIVNNDNRSGKNASLLSLLNNCKTSIGKRFFKKCLLNPITNSSKIVERYDMIDFFLKDNLYNKIREHLGKISDLERLFKRISMKTLQPYEFLSIHNSFLSILEIIKILENYEKEMLIMGWKNDYIKELKNWIDTYTKNFNLNKMNKLSLKEVAENIFNTGIYKELDDMQDHIHSLEDVFENICYCLNEGEDNSEEFKLKSNKDNIKIISVTRNRYEKLLKNTERVKKIDKLLQNSNNNIVKNLSISDFEYKPLTPNNKTEYKIIFPDMYENQVKLSKVQDKLRKMIVKLYIDSLEFFYENYEKLMLNITNFIASVDLFTCNAKNSIDYCYNRPEIYDDNCSYIQSEKIRHPLIEVIQKDIPYIANDVSIGLEKEKGILLYGINSVGKSSYMKSIGMNLIMAQCGMYVAAKKFQYSPYDHIFSRMPSGDNLHEGKSTYVCEINELRTILKRSTQRSLVIGDELCSGTEITSALAIIAAGIKTLSDRGCSFIFATHLHELCDLECIKNIQNMEIYNLSVEFDKENNCLIYDRKLKKGNGNTLYGLEIAKSLDLPPEFLLFANQVRQEHTNMNKNFVEPKISRYSSEVFMDKCKICSSECQEVHHITEQRYANENNILEEEQIHKNRKSNLITVCQKCHDKIHNNEFKIDGYQQTSEGIKLKIENKINIQKAEKIIDNIDNVNIDNKIKNLRSEGYSYNKIYEKINQEHKNITMYRIKKILK